MTAVELPKRSGSTSTRSLMRCLGNFFFGNRQHCIRKYGRRPRPSTPHHIRCTTVTTMIWNSCDGLGRLYVGYEEGYIGSSKGWASSLRPVLRPTETRVTNNVRCVPPFCFVRRKEGVRAIGCPIPRDCGCSIGVLITCSRRLVLSFSFKCCCRERWRCIVPIVDVLFVSILVDTLAKVRRGLLDLDPGSCCGNGFSYLRWGAGRGGRIVFSEYGGSTILVLPESFSLSSSIDNSAYPTIICTPPERRIESNRIRSNQIKSNQIESNRIESNRIKSNRIESNRIESNHPTTTTAV